METKTNTPAELNSKITNFVKDLAKETDEARISQTMQNYLQFCASFYNYSLNNQFLIFLFRSNATLVAGYHDWLKKHRYVKKGERGIPILAPIPMTEEDDNGKKVVKQMRFKTVYVFDIAQTEGEPLPETPEWKSPEKYPELEDMLINYARSLKIKVEIEDLSASGAQGYSQGGKIGLDPTAGTKTLIHEIAHELLHHNNMAKLKSRAEIELEAEAIAYVVSRALEMDNLKSPNYLAIWDADGKKIMDRLDTIRNTARQILTAIFPVK
ncbi:MAG: ArdC-like ssDNA-binding domain-containing protein [Anaerolineaceae bacterium]